MLSEKGVLLLEFRHFCHVHLVYSLKQFNFALIEAFMSRSKVILDLKLGCI